MEWKKAGWFWIIGMVASLYTTLVLQSLWNWFVATAFNISSVSYWQMYGVVLVVKLLSVSGKESMDAFRWKVLDATLAVCIPKEKIEELNEILKQEEEGLWLQAGISVLGSIIGNTVTLAIGWGVHTFLS